MCCVFDIIFGCGVFVVSLCLVVCWVVCWAMGGGSYLVECVLNFERMRKRSFCEDLAFVMDRVVVIDSLPLSISGSSIIVCRLC